MGISTIQSYRSAQIFECIGINSDVVNKYFTGTPTRIEGIGLDIIAKETLERHNIAYNKLKVSKDIDPFLTLSFLALPVIPEIKLTDKGLFDVQKFEFIDLI